MILGTFIGLPASAANFHVDCRAGNDDHDGRSPGTADAVVVVFEGESYIDQESVMRTVGLRPAALRPARMAYAKKVTDFASAIGTKVVTLHMGFLPRDRKDPVYGEMLEAVGTLAGYAASKGVTLSLETGQETGEELARFLDAITVARVGVNFDTANLVLYGLDDPPRALEREVPLGEGRAQVKECLRLLDSAGFRGPSSSRTIPGVTGARPPSRSSPGRGTSSWAPRRRSRRSRDWAVRPGSSGPLTALVAGRAIRRNDTAKPTTAAAGLIRLSAPSTEPRRPARAGPGLGPQVRSCGDARRETSFSTWETVNKLKDKVVSTDVSRLSADGKTLTVVSKGTRPSGKAFENEYVMTRVSGGPGLPGSGRPAR